MPAVARSVLPSKPMLATLTEVIAWAHLHRHPICLSPLIGHGVRCISTEGRVVWERDRTQRGVSVIGAAVLMFQPRATVLPDAGAEALGCSLPFIEGLADGLELATRSRAWETSPARHRYLAAYELATLLHMAIRSRTCPRHGRYPISDSACPVCAAAEVGAGPAKGDA